ncbi:MAG TPA: hypothetical protein VGW33_13280 [Terriglobia bacterium]|nr:hypothetical protein [Terriglobia bacterium]
MGEKLAFGDSAFKLADPQGLRQAAGRKVLLLFKPAWAVPYLSGTFTTTQLPGVAALTAAMIA